MNEIKVIKLHTLSSMGESVDCNFGSSCSSGEGLPYPDLLCDPLFKSVMKEPSFIFGTLFIPSAPPILMVPEDDGLGN
jgi:hypothetical protein